MSEMCDKYIVWET